MAPLPPLRRLPSLLSGDSPPSSPVLEEAAAYSLGGTSINCSQKSQHEMFHHQETSMQCGEFSAIPHFFTQVGQLSASIRRSIADARVGDTITHFVGRTENSLPGYDEATPMVFCGVFPVDADQFPELCEALEKLHLNDASNAANCASSTIIMGDCLLSPHMLNYATSMNSESVVDVEGVVPVPLKPIKATTKQFIR